MNEPVDERFLGALAEARALGFLGPGDLDEHVASARAFLAALRDHGADGPALDLGSGGGVPGLLLAIWTGWRWTFLDASRRRTSFLAATAAQLGLHEQVTVVRARAEEVGRQASYRGQFRAVTARSFAPPAITAECAAPLLSLGALLVVAEPPDGPARWDRDGIRSLGLEREEIRPTERRVVVFRAVEASPLLFPRPWKQQMRHPLF